VVKALANNKNFNNDETFDMERFDSHDYEYIQTEYERLSSKQHRHQQREQLKSRTTQDRLRIESGFDVEDLDDLEQEVVNIQEQIKDKIEDVLTLLDLLELRMSDFE
jgi:predicted  nucleic acid-binding Zn-ribbon protein